MDESTSRHQQPQAATANKFVGFSWGPRPNAFDVVSTPHTPLREVQNVPDHVDCRVPSAISRTIRPPLLDVRFSEPANTVNRFETPVRPFIPHAQSTIPRTVGFPTSVRPTRVVSDREALRQMINCVGASARKKVLESGRKPRFVSLLRRPSSAFSVRGERELPRIPSLQLRTDATEAITIPRRGELNASDSMYDGAPPSPSPRPGSSMSRRSGAASPYPFTRSSAPSPMLNPAGSVTATLSSSPSLPVGATTSRSSTMTLKKSPLSRVLQNNIALKRSASNLAKHNSQPEPLPATATLRSPKTTRPKQKANKSNTDALDRIGNQLDSLFGNLVRIEDELRILKSLNAPSKDPP